MDNNIYVQAFNISISQGQCYSTRYTPQTVTVFSLMNSIPTASSRWRTDIFLFRWKNKNLYILLLYMEVAIILDWLRIFGPTSIRNAFIWSNSIVLCLNVGMYNASAILTNMGCTRYKKTSNVIMDGKCLVTNNFCHTSIIQPHARIRDSHFDSIAYVK